MSAFSESALIPQSSHKLAQQKNLQLKRCLKLGAAPLSSRLTDELDRATILAPHSCLSLVQKNCENFKEMKTISYGFTKQYISLHIIFKYILGIF